jgi:hypothetical protein
MRSAQGGGTAVGNRFRQAPGIEKELKHRAAQQGISPARNSRMRFNTAPDM